MLSRIVTFCDDKENGKNGDEHVAGREEQKEKQEEGTGEEGFCRKRDSRTP